MFVNHNETERAAGVEDGFPREKERYVNLLEPDRKPGILSPMALTFSRSQSWRISISETFIVGNCNWGGVIVAVVSQDTKHY